MMANDLSIEFRLLVGEEQRLVDDLLKDPDRLLEYYVTDDDNTDSTFQGGFCIFVDGKKWNGDSDYYFDMFSYTLNWLRGLEELLHGARTVDVGFWEESVATASLDGTKLIITDKHVGGRMRAVTAIVDFQNFCRRILIESRKYEELAVIIKNRLSAKGNPYEVKRARFIVQEMCATDFAEKNNSLERLIEKQFVS